MLEVVKRTARYSTLLLVWKIAWAQNVGEQGFFSKFLEFIGGTVSLLLMLGIPIVIVGYFVRLFIQAKKK